jgi:glutamate synthase (NADPH/NADH) small chain
LDVLILGGGDTGNDCVATAIRQGCRTVRQLEILPQPSFDRPEGNPWPEWPKILKIDYGQWEAIARAGEDPRVYEAATEALLGENGRVKAVRANVAGARQEFGAQLVLLAMGFLGPESALLQKSGVAMDARGRAVVDGYGTQVPRLYLAGDARRGQSLVVWAIREGVEAAEAAGRGMVVA